MSEPVRRTHRIVAVRVDGRARIYGEYESQNGAADVCHALLKNGMNAYVERIDAGETPDRAAEHWFLDAAVYARDGDRDQALAAARRGIAALEALGPREG